MSENQEFFNKINSPDFIESVKRQALELIDLETEGLLDMAEGYPEIQEKIIFRKQLRKRLKAINDLFLTAQESFYNMKILLTEINDKVEEFVSSAEKIGGDIIKLGLRVGRDRDEERSYIVNRWERVNVDTIEEVEGDVFNYRLCKVLFLLFRLCCHYHMAKVFTVLP